MPATVGRRMDRLAPVQPCPPVGSIVGPSYGSASSPSLFYAAWLAIGAFGRPYNFFDMKIYHGAVVWWASGTSSTSSSRPRPPSASPTRRSPAWSCCRWRSSDRRRRLGQRRRQHRRAGASCCAALLGPIADRLRLVALVRRGPRRCRCAAAIEPVRETLGYGQVNLLLFALIMADMVALRWRARRAPASPPTAARCCASSRRRLGRRRHRPGHRDQADPGAVHRLPAGHPPVAGGDRPRVGTAVGVTAATFAVAGRESAAYFGQVHLADRAGRRGRHDAQPVAGRRARPRSTTRSRPPALLWLVVRAADARARACPARPRAARRR